MKNITVLILVVALSAGACRMGQKATKNTSASTDKKEQMDNKSIGKVSHQYKATGCATVVIINKDGETITLIPKDMLDAKLDVDGLEITFNYRPLKMPNPAGCTAGFPAELTNIKPAK
jgi:thioredoxin-related protein